ncbi:MAG: hypothetical protein K8I30_14415, partial [Anaerolineae bacterium]|nr:hypothetical protein [Anaerolineae bacterium]
TGTLALAFSADGQYLTTIIRNDEGNTTNCIDCGKIQVWNVADLANPHFMGETAFHLDAIKTAAISENGRYAAVPEMTPDGLATGVGIWEMPALRQIGTIPLASPTLPGSIDSLDLDADGRRIAVVHRIGVSSPVNDSSATQNGVVFYVFDWQAADNGDFTYTSPYSKALESFVYRYDVHLNADGARIHVVNTTYNTLAEIILATGDMAMMGL